MQGHRPCILHLIFIPPSRSWRDFSAYLHPVLLPRSRNIRAAAAAPLPGFLNNPVPVSLLSGGRKPQIRFLGNRHSGSGNLYHKFFRM